MRGVNEAEIWPLVRFAAEHGLPLRLIELMPLTTTEVLTEKNFLPCGEVMQFLSRHDELIDSWSADSATGRRSIFG